MARRPAMASILLSLAALLAPTLATRWTVTSWYIVEVTTSTYSTYTDEFDKYTMTATRTVKPDFTPTATEALDVETTIVTYDDLKIVQIYLPKTEVPQSEVVPVQTDYTYDSGPYTYYVQPEVWTAPSSCPTPFTVTSWKVVDIPSEVVSRYTPKTVQTSYHDGYDGSIYTDITAYLTEVVSSVNLKTDFYYTEYIEQCVNPTASRGSSYYGGGDDGNDGDYGWGGWCHHGYGVGCALKIWVIVVASVIPALFLLGLIENYFWFRRLMLGKGTLRFGTVCWVCLTLLVLCFTRSVPARSPEDQKKLKEAWANVSAGQRIKLWFKHGFRRRYPVELLGEHPTWRNGHQGPMVQFAGPNGGPGGPGGAAGPAGPNQGQGGWVYYTAENGQVHSQWYQNPPQVVQGQQGTQVAYYPPPQHASYPQQGQHLQGFPPGQPPQGFPPGQPAPFGYPPSSPQSPSYEMSTATPTPHLSHVSAVVGEKTISTPSPSPQTGYPSPPAQTGYPVPPAQVEGTEPQEMATSRAPPPPNELGTATSHVVGQPGGKPETRS